jgi:hypothetical protein
MMPDPLYQYALPGLRRDSQGHLYVNIRRWLRYQRQVQTRLDEAIVRRGCQRLAVARGLVFIEEPRGEAPWQN